MRDVRKSVLVVIYLTNCLEGKSGRIQAKFDKVFKLVKQMERDFAILVPVAEAQLTDAQSR